MDSLDIAEYNTETSDKKQEVTMTVHLDNKDYPILTLCAYQYDGENCLVMLNDTTLALPNVVWSLICRRPSMPLTSRSC